MDLKNNICLRTLFFYFISRTFLYKYVSRETLEISKDKPYSFQFSVKSYIIIPKIKLVSTRLRQ